MIALLRGEVAVRRPDHVVILCGGVGYRAAVSAETLRHVPAGRRGGHAAHPPDRARRRARAVRLSLRAGARPVPDAAVGAGGRAEGRARRALRRHAARADRARSPAATPLASRPCPGIGKRTAERIIVELREKVGGQDRAPADGPRSLAPGAASGTADAGPRGAARARLRARRGRASCCATPRATAPRS